MGFPKYIYKRGTGQQVGEDGPWTAESMLVNSEEEMKGLDGGWCDSPAEAGLGGSASHPTTTFRQARETKAPEAKADEPEAKHEPKHKVK